MYIYICTYVNVCVCLCVCDKPWIKGNVLWSGSIHMFKVESTKQVTALWGVKRMRLDPVVRDIVWHAMPAQVHDIRCSFHILNLASVTCAAHWFACLSEKYTDLFWPPKFSRRGLQVFRVLSEKHGVWIRKQHHTALWDIKCIISDTAAFCNLMQLSQFESGASLHLQMCSALVCLFSGEVQRTSFHRRS